MTARVLVTGGAGFIGANLAFHPTAIADLGRNGDQMTASPKHVKFFPHR